MPFDRRLIWVFREDLHHHRSSKNRWFETCVCSVYRKISGPKRNGTWDTVYDRFEVTGFCNVMIYLTAFGLPPGGSSTVHIYTQTIHRTTQSTQTVHRTTQFNRTQFNVEQHVTPSVISQTFADVYGGFSPITFLMWRHAVAQLVEALRYKSEGRGFDSRWRHWNFSLT